jgi:hypothetical protein
MGVDTLITNLPIEEGLEPDWQAARDALESMSDEDLEDIAESLYATGNDLAPASEVRAALFGAIERVEGAIENGSRELDLITLPGWTVYVTGGSNAGDATTDLYEAFRDLDDSGLSVAAGFLHHSPASVGPETQQHAIERGPRFARIIELLEPTVISGSPFTPETRYVFFADANKVDGCYPTFERAMSAFSDRGTEYNLNQPPPMVIDLDEFDITIQAVTYNGIEGMSIGGPDGLYIESYFDEEPETLGESLDERRAAIRDWWDEWSFECD